MGKTVSLTAVSHSSGLLEHLVRDDNSAPTLADFRRVLQASLARLMGADTVSMMDPPGLEAPDGAVRERTVVTGVGAPLLERFLAQRRRYDRSLARMLRVMRSGRPVIDTEVYSSRDRQQLAVYRELFNPQRTTSILAAEVPGGRSIASALIVFKRQGRASPFRRRDVSRLDALLQVIAVAEAGFRCGLEARQAKGVFVQGLTTREAQVASLASRGMRNAEIAALLGTSVETTKKQLKKVFDKVEVSNRTELAMLWSSRASA